MRLLLTAGIAAAVLRGSRAPDDPVRVLLGGKEVSVGRAAVNATGVPYLNGTIEGKEYGCLGCPQPLFASYLASIAGKPVPVKMHPLYAGDYYQRRDILQIMFKDRRLVLGSIGGLTDMSFTDSLVDLSRTSPKVYQQGFDGPRDSKYHVGVEVEGAERSGAAMLAEMRAVWPKIDELAYVEGKDEQNKANAAEVVKRVKQQFEFYRMRCLAPQCDVEGAFPPGQAQTVLLGTVACADDSPESDCVYAEARQCQSAKCGHAWAEFPRFHGLGKLLEVKRGRCSELSRVAYGMYLALGYDTRMIIDFTDHVWTEVRLPRGADGEWFHNDPSEGVFNKPLMYEKGWGKKLTFIFAFTPHSIEDVSKRYTAKYDEMVTRRGVDDATLAKEVDLANHRIRFEQPMKQWGYSETGSSLENVALLSHFM